jgi:hypothetical protein
VALYLHSSICLRGVKEDTCISGAFYSPVICLGYDCIRRLWWSSVSHAGLWFPSSRVQTRPKPLDFSVYKKILSMPSFGGEVK